MTRLQSTKSVLGEPFVSAPTFGGRRVPRQRQANVSKGLGNPALLRRGTKRGDCLARHAAVQPLAPADAPTEGPAADDNAPGGHILLKLPPPRLSTAVS